MKAKPRPVPTKSESRICYGISYFTSEADAEEYARQTKGRTYNGGYCDGMPCGREIGRDYVDPKHGKLYAVTD